MATDLDESDAAHLAGAIISAFAGGHAWATLGLVSVEGALVTLTFTALCFYGVNSVISRAEGGDKRVV